MTSNKFEIYLDERTGYSRLFLLKYNLYLQTFTRYKFLNIVVRTISRRNRPRLFHALVEIRRARRTPGVRLFDSPVT